ncbi:hypothetical protein M5689_024924 [Euphorbia peplus]|nr:hypothetical protein M5689_024924 [Euphorbia peplus]
MKSISLKRSLRREVKFMFELVEDVAGVYLSHKNAGRLSIIFDVGGLLAGLCDRSERDNINGLLSSINPIPHHVQSLWKFINGCQHNFDVPLGFACRQSLLTNYNNNGS